jgi:putative ABC transport system permease protein
MYTFNYNNKTNFGTAQVGKYNAVYSMLAETPIYELKASHLGGIDVASEISIYPADFDVKDKVTNYLDAWNEKGDITLSDGRVIKYEDRIETNYTDALELIISMINTMIDVVTYALIAFTSLALVVSCVMIAIITYVSVVERVKEIGVIRSLGGRKKDVSNLFNAETLIIGLTSGAIGIGFTYVLSFIINIIVKSLAGFTIMNLTIGSALIMMLLSVGLTVLSGIIPSRKAAKQDPVVALRTE